MGTLKRFNLARLKADLSLDHFAGSSEGENAAWAIKRGLAVVADDAFDQNKWPQLPRTPMLFWLPAAGANSSALSPMLSDLLAQRAGCCDVIVIDSARNYLPGQYQAGECPPGTRAWEQEQALRAVLQRAEATHQTSICAADHGYVVLLPRAANKSAPGSVALDQYLNILPYDQPESLSLLLDIPGATSLSMQRRMHDSRFATRYLVGQGIDVGGGIDSLALYTELFPLIRNVVVYDEPNGDAQLLENVPDDVFDFLYSSHCLEHVRDPLIALQNWIRVVRPGGYLVISAPDEDLYEQRIWPSTFNADHKFSFTLHKSKSWSPVSVNLLDLLSTVSHLAQPLSIMTIDHAYRFQLERFDQTRTPLAECSIEFVLRKL